MTSLASNPQVFSYKGIAYVTDVNTGLRSETDLSEPGMLSLGKKHQVDNLNIMLHSVDYYIVLLQFCLNDCGIEEAQPSSQTYLLENLAILQRFQGLNLSEFYSSLHCLNGKQKAEAWILYFKLLRSH